MIITIIIIIIIIMILAYRVILGGNVLDSEICITLFIRLCMLFRSLVCLTSNISGWDCVKWSLHISSVTEKPPEHCRHLNKSAPRSYIWLNPSLPPHWPRSSLSRQLGSWSLKTISGFHSLILPIFPKSRRLKIRSSQFLAGCQH